MPTTDDMRADGRRISEKYETFYRNCRSIIQHGER